jgi:glycosyltransferase involved in cell wall biosynthesis
MKKNKKPRIAVIGLKGLPAFGGAATVGENIIEQLKNQYDITVYSISSHTNRKSGNYNNICYQKVFKSIPFKKLNSLLYYIRAAFHVLFSNFNLVHLHHRDAAFIVPLLRLKYKVALTTHGMVLTDKWKPFKFFFNTQDKLFLKFANQITTVSKKDFRIVQNILLNKKEIVFIPNGVNLLDKFNIQIENKIVFSAGRIVPNKGCHILLEALKKGNINIKTQIIGDLEQMSDYGTFIKKQANELLQVEFIDLIKEKDELFKLLASSKIFVYPTLIESMSMMMLEVASLGVPMIVSRLPENLDVFNEDEVLYFQPANSKDLCKKIKYALNNKNEMVSRAQKAKNKVISNYLWSNISNQYANVYNNLL